MSWGDSFPQRAVEPGAHARTGVVVTRLGQDTYVGAQRGVVAYGGGRPARLIDALKEENLIPQGYVRDEEVFVYDENVVILRGDLCEAFRLAPERFVECVRRAFGGCEVIRDGYVGWALGNPPGEVKFGEGIVVFIHRGPDGGGAVRPGNPFPGGVR